MLETRIYKQGLQNSYAATIVDTTSISGKVCLPGLDPIPLAGIKNVIERTAVTEVRQFVQIAMPTIAASTRYSVRGAELQVQDSNKNYNKLKEFAHTSPATLSGTALTDKVNVLNNIGYKINQARKGGWLRAWGGPIATFTHASATYAVGDYIEGNTSGARGYIAKVNSATEALIIMISTNDFTDTETVSLNGTSTGITVTTNVYTGALGVLDDAGYYPAMGHRTGTSTWVPGDNIGTTEFTVTTAGVYSFGQGTRMLDDVPVLSNTSPNLHSGYWGFPTNVAPVAGNTYSQFIIIYEEDTSPDPMRNAASKVEKAQAIWLYDQEGDFAATQTAILAL